MPTILESTQAASCTGDAQVGPLALVPAGERAAFAALHAAVTSDWGPRDAYERRWVIELVTSMWRQDRLRALELATLAASAEESPPSEATVKKLLGFARYGARIDKDIGRALYALRVLRNRPDERIDELQDGTSEPKAAEAPQQNYTNDFSPCTHEPEPANTNLEPCTSEPAPPTLNRHQRRALAAMLRRRAA